MCCHHFSAFFTVADIRAPFFLCPPIEDFSEEALPISSYVEYSVTNAPGSLIWDINAELEALFDTDPRATSVHPCRQRTVLLAPPSLRSFSWSLLVCCDSPFETISLQPQIVAGSGAVQDGGQAHRG